MLTRKLKENLVDHPFFFNSKKTNLPAKGHVLQVDHCVTAHTDTESQTPSPISSHSEFRVVVHSCKRKMGKIECHVCQDEMLLHLAKKNKGVKLQGSLIKQIKCCLGCDW